MKITIIKVMAIVIIALFVWWGIWGHTMSSNESNYWFHETSPQIDEHENAYGGACAPAYPIIAFGIIAAFWTIIIISQGGIKWYGSELSKKLFIWYSAFTFCFIIFLLIICNN